MELVLEISDMETAGVKKEDSQSISSTSDSQYGYGFTPRGPCQLSFPCSWFCCLFPDDPPFLNKQKVIDFNANAKLSDVASKTIKGIRFRKC